MKQLEVKIAVPDSVDGGGLLSKLRRYLADTFGPEYQVVDDNVDTTDLEYDHSVRASTRKEQKAEGDRLINNYSDMLEDLIKKIPDSELPLHEQYSSAERKRDLKARIATDKLAKDGYIQ